MIDVSLRKAEEADFKKIFSLIKELAEFEKSLDQLTNTPERMAAEKDYFECFVIEPPEHEMVGYIVYYYCYYTWVGKAMYMDDLYIRPEFRKQGIGLWALNRMIELARQTGCHRIRWQVLDWNTPAINLYRKAGAKVGSPDRNCDIVL